jgi:parvulin-like peptidyl-prolyl isomerase
MQRFTLGLLLAAALPLHADNASVAGRIGDLELTTGELRESIAGLEAGNDAPLVKDPAGLNQYARALLIQRLVLKQAQDAKWDQDPAIVAKLVRARETALAESYLASKSAPETEYPSDADIQSAYDASKAKLLIPRSFLLSQIFINAPEGADATILAAAKTKLDGVVKQLTAKGADFSAIARQASEETTSAAQGGKIGWLTETQIQPEIREKLPKLTLGALSEPIRLKDGWHILKVLDVREARTPVLAEIRSQLVAKLRAERTRAKRQEFLTQLLKDHPLAINEIELAKLLSQP